MMYRTTPLRPFLPLTCLLTVTLPYLFFLLSNLSYIGFLLILQRLLITMLMDYFLMISSRVVCHQQHRVCVFGGHSPLLNMVSSYDVKAHRLRIPPPSVFFAFFIP